MKMLYCCLILALAACTTVDDGSSGGGPDAGSGSNMYPDGSVGDELPSADEAHAVCFTSLEGGEKWTSCEDSPSVLPGKPADQPLYWLGFCGQAQNYELAPVLGTVRNGRIAFRNDQIGLEDGHVCEFTYAWKENGGTWHYAQYGDNLMSQSRSGALRACGNRTYRRADGSTYVDYRCAMFQVAVAGHRSKPYGAYPPGPIN